MLCYGADNLQIAGFLRGQTANMRVKTAYRTFTSRKENPDAWVEFGVAKSSGQFSESQSLSAIGAGKMWIQGGIAGASTSGTSQGETSLQCFANSKARVIGAQMFEIEPDTNSTKTAILTFGPPIPSLGITGLMIAGAVYGVGGTLKFNFCTREFVADAAVPGAWSSGLITEVSLTTDGDYNSSNVAVSATTGNSLIQLGVMIPANDARGMLDFVYAAKY
jgi:hypothetical protein